MVRHGSANAPVFERTQTHAACFASRPLTVSLKLCRHCGVSLVVVVLIGAVVILGWFAFPVGLRTAESFNQTVSRFCGARSAPRSLTRGYTPGRRLRRHSPPLRAATAPPVSPLTSKQKASRRTVTLSKCFRLTRIIHPCRCPTVCV